jgi:hypothetical protein
MHEDVELMQAMLRMFKETHLNKIHEKNNKYFSKLGRKYYLSLGIQNT